MSFQILLRTHTPTVKLGFTMLMPFLVCGRGKKTQNIYGIVVKSILLGRFNCKIMSVYLQDYILSLRGRIDNR